MHIGGHDYDQGPYTVKFPAGETRVSVDISIVYQPYAIEHDEDFHLGIAETKLSDGIARGYPSIIKVDILECEYGYGMVTLMNRCIRNGLGSKE